MNKTPTEKSIGIAARLWCLPQHEKKEMDVLFAADIARAIDQARIDTINECAEICHQVARNDAGVWYISATDCTEKIKKLLDEA